MKRISQLDQDLDKAQEQLAEANNKLEEANKKSADVSTASMNLGGIYCCSLTIRSKPITNLQ